MTWLLIPAMIMSNLHNRVKRLEAHKTAPALRDVFTVRPVNYRAGIMPGIQDAPGAIPLRIVDVKPPEVKP